MLSKLIFVVLSVGVTLISATAMASPGVFGMAQIQTLFPGDLGRDCIFFTLAGVADAQSPSVPGSPWFVLSKAHPNFKEQYALILASKMSGTPIGVVTTGNGLPACTGHAEVSYVYVQ